MDALNNFLNTAKQEFESAVDLLDKDSIQKAAEIICDAENKGNRIHITGIGKPAHVAAYIASLLSSTGTPTYFLHGTEAVHGSCGQLVPGDVIICISNSGETPEMKSTATAIRNNGCLIIGVTRNRDSWLAVFSDIHIYAGAKNEGGPLNRAPRTSILAEILVLQALSVVLQESRGLTPQEYVQRHPGGMLGQIRDEEK